MENKSITFPEIQERYNELIEEALFLNYLVRDIDLQKAKIDELAAFISLLRSAKAQAIQRGFESNANVLFHFQCVLNSLKSILRMWVELKTGDLSDAWCLLVDAQEYADVANRIPLPAGAAWGIQDLQQHLAKIQQTIFPRWPKYFSTGHVESPGKCSICRKPYSDCDEHIEGMIYAGRLCERIDRKILQADHSAMVDDPKDRRCIIRYISTESGNKKDYITWKVLEEKFQKYDGAEGHLMVEGVLLTAKRLDFN